MIDKVIVGVGERGMYAYSVVTKTFWFGGVGVPHPQTGKFLSQHCMYMSVHSTLADTYNHFDDR